MTTFPDSPRLRKAAIVSVALPTPKPNIIGFQYNPDSLTRKIEPRSQHGQESGSRLEALRLAGPPRETISLSIEVDSIDAFDQVPPVPLANGMYPALSALELLVYPSSTTLIANAALAAFGLLEMKAPEAPLCMFVWGPQRVLPVRLTTLTITEEAFDPDLNPIRAKADISMDVLTAFDLTVSHPGYFLYMAYQVAKEALALTNTVTKVADIGVSLNPF